MLQKSMFIAMFFGLLLISGCVQEPAPQQNQTIIPDVNDTTIPDVNDTAIPPDATQNQSMNQSEINETISEPVVNDTNMTTPPTPQTKEFDIEAKQWEFTPDTITVNKGDTVILHVTSIDVDHVIVINQFGVSERLTSGQTVDIQFVADKSGTYTFFCNVFCGSGHSGMRGTLIVE
jgi:cytochrome c oxidase subunit 2